MKKLPNTASDAGSKAREQAEAYNSLLADQELELEDGSILKVPPHPDLGMMDDEQMEAYEELLVEVESYDREPDIVIPEQKLRELERESRVPGMYAAAWAKCRKPGGMTPDLMRGTNWVQIGLMYATVLEQAG